ncbi:AI-2E family transporter [Croceibacterium aestuarii]|uniref:AI-2E family transporter n=1 Tax=Croceibacterium aestuarii TaxID=3064139 RepID=UPI00272E9A8E|nr:AI-2E family transporter [Croceibacterium sp. D39]
MSDSIPPEPQPAQPPRRRALTFAAQELRLISSLVLLLALGLFLALPFVLSIGAVVFLPVVTAIILTIVLSPLADRLAQAGLPNLLASLLSLIVFLAVLILALTAVFRPAVGMFDEMPALLGRIGEHFRHLQHNFAWVSSLNRQVLELTGREEGREVVLKTPTMLEQVAFATPTVVLEILLTFLMSFFMIEGRVRMRRRLLLDRQHFGSSVKAARVIRDVQDRVAAYILTVGLINLGVGVIVTLGAWAMGVDAPFMWGGLAMLLNFLPYIGPLTMVALLALFGLGSSASPFLGILPALAYLGLHAIESNVVTPAILGARFTMSPVMILIALSYFTWIWGVTGALLSVPILLAVTALIDHLGKPNLIGFIFGEPLFTTNPLDLGVDDDVTADTP